MFEWEVLVDFNDVLALVVVGLSIGILLMGLNDNKYFGVCYSKGIEMFGYCTELLNK